MVTYWPVKRDCVHSINRRKYIASKVSIVWRDAFMLLYRHRDVITL